MDLIKQFEVYWVNLDPTEGSEIQKTRPCIIVTPDEMNTTLNTIMVVPLTHTIINWPFRTTVTVNGNISSAACDQLRTIAKERLRDYIGSITAAEKDKILVILQAIFSE
ncbi:MAG: type II toxin-antitoxin system PemK/MazF family toxin [bacterium]